MVHKSGSLSNPVVHSIWKRGCCGFRFNEVSRSITRFLECPHARFLINSWNVDSDEAIRNVLIIFFFFFYFGVAVRKLNFLRPQISALGRSHLSTAAEHYLLHQQYVLFLFFIL